MGRLIFRAVQCEMELDYITVSRLWLVSVAIVCESIRIGFSYYFRIYPGCSDAYCCLVYTTAKHLT